MKRPVYNTEMKDLRLIKRGKVRDLYDLDEYLLLVATDRLSAFDVVLPDPILNKGKVLTQISLFWFKIMESIVENHLVASDVEDFPEICKPYADILRDRSMLVRKTEPLPVECVVRGYISGSGWKSYQNDGTICGIKLPPGMKESEKLQTPIFTPSTKEEVGLHDINIDFNEAVNKIGKERAEKVRDYSLAIYNKGVEIAAELGIIIADTKFEFGIYNDKIILIDEILTPDSSRFWPQADYSPGGAQKSYDKQYVRDYLLTLDWDKTAPGPELPKEIINKTISKYMEALKLFNPEKAAELS